MNTDINKFYPGDIPQKPGVYIFRDKFKKVIYVGKAANLRKRMSQYFQKSRHRANDIKQRSLINSIDSWEFITVRNESESLILESRLIKKYSPYYNVLLRDDKRFFLIKIDFNDKYPRLSLVRFKKNDNARYFGPFPHSRVLKQLINFFSVYFKLRLCKFRNPGERERAHCIEAHVKRCCQPCIGKISREEYMSRVSSLLKIFDGNTKEIIDDLKLKMQNYSEQHAFERAAELRDMIDNIVEVFKNRPRSFEFATITKPARENSMEELQQVLGLNKKPSHIEAIDISNFSSQFAVSSLVCFIDGKPAKDRYKRFKIKTVHGIDDFAMMKETVTRHFRRTLEENRKQPDLLIIDGGKGQLSSAVKALIDLKVKPFPVIGLAKKNEEIFLPGKSNPVIISKFSDSLKLIQSVRDEAHRFAVTYNRKLRLKRIQESLLDDIPGIGEKRKLALLSAFSSINEIRKSSPEKIAEKVECIGVSLAETLVYYLNKKQDLKK